MELDRAHRRAPSTTSDLFICFSSRLIKSSSMRLSSISPGRSDHNKPPISLSASLSRKLRTKNGSLRGGQSPMFPPGGVIKKRGCAIENNPEPSSPKVTCIGQVRVKTKKHGKKMKSHMKKAYRARRSGSNGGKDPSFRRNEGEGCLQHRNQRWVHLPVTICDALRAFGSELNCFSGCRRPSSCCSRNEAVRREKKSSSRRSSSCGGSVCKWLVSLHEGDGKRRDIELVVGEEEERGKVERVVMERECSRRRSIFDDMDFNADEVCEEKSEIVEEEEEEEEAARVSICIPPKNALLLMRCRSDPVKMSALAHKFWESPPNKDQQEDDKIGEGVGRRRSSFSVTEKIESLLRFVKDEEEEEGQKLPEVKKEEFLLKSTEPRLEVDSESQQCAEPEMYEELVEEEKYQQHRPSIDDSKERDCEKVYDDDDDEEEAKSLEIAEDPDEEAEVVSQSGQSVVPPPESAPSIQHQLEEKVCEKENPIEVEDEIQPPPLEEEVKTQNRADETLEKAIEEEEEDGEEEEDSESGDVMLGEEEEEETSALPECLLLMMCEPKLSMEVSKETWVCSTDFIRWLPERHRQHHLKKINPSNAGDDATKKNKKKNRATNAESNPAPRPPPPAARAPKQPPAPAGFQPARSSCSFPIGGRVSAAAAVKEKKAANYEPTGLKRCKSAPMRSAAAKLAPAPEMACFWKNRKIEPHRPATCGVGAPGVGC